MHDLTRFHVFAGNIAGKGAGDGLHLRSHHAKILKRQYMSSIVYPFLFDFLCRLTIIIQAFCINDIENTFSIFVDKNRSKPYKSTVFTEFISKIA